MSWEASLPAPRGRISQRRLSKPVVYIRGGSNPIAWHNGTLTATCRPSESPRIDGTTTEDRNNTPIQDWNSLCNLVQWTERRRRPLCDCWISKEIWWSVSVTTTTPHLTSPYHEPIAPVHVQRTCNKGNEKRRKRDQTLSDSTIVLGLRWSICAVLRRRGKRKMVKYAKWTIHIYVQPK